MAKVFIKKYKVTHYGSENSITVHPHKYVWESGMEWEWQYTDEGKFLVLGAKWDELKMGEVVRALKLYMHDSAESVLLKDEEK